MNNPNNIENTVLSILKENHEARNDDMKLYLLVCERFAPAQNGNIGAMPFAVIMNCYKELCLPHFESVRRVRAKLQATHPEIACDPACRKSRKVAERL